MVHGILRYRSRTAFVRSRSESSKDQYLVLVRSMDETLDEAIVRFHSKYVGAKVAAPKINGDSTKDDATVEDQAAKCLTHDMKSMRRIKEPVRFDELPILELKTLKTSDTQTIISYPPYNLTRFEIEKIHSYVFSSDDLASDYSSVIKTFADKAIETDPVYVKPLKRQRSQAMALIEISMKSNTSKHSLMASDGSDCEDMAATCAIRQLDSAGEINIEQIEAGEPNEIVQEEEGFDTDDEIRRIENEIDRRYFPEKYVARINRRAIEAGKDNGKDDSLQNESRMIVVRSDDGINDPKEPKRSYRLLGPFFDEVVLAGADIFLYYMYRIAGIELPERHEIP